MKIYTKGGDKGETSLFGGKRVSKDELLLHVYGTVDELNSLIGVCRSLSLDEEIDQILNAIQSDLFVLGADLATPLRTSLPGKKPPKDTPNRVNPSQVQRLEACIDRYDAPLSTLKNFILPGGGPAGATLHLARTICRRAERGCVSALREEKTHLETVRYLNRLSDLLFVLARTINHRQNYNEETWKPSELDPIF